MFFKKQTDDFEATALPYLDELYRTARRLLGDQASAEDVVQETFMRAWRSYRTFQPGSNCRAWLYKILLNAVADARKKRFGSLEVVAEEGVLESHAASIQTPDRLTDAEILAALDSLPYAYREAVLLADIEELSYREIAELLEVKIGTVMSRLNRGRGLLRAKLAKTAEGYGIGGSSAGGVA